MPRDIVARRMVESLAGHDILASAPSWDGKWMGALLRSSGLSRQALRPRDTEEAQCETARAQLAHAVALETLETEVEDVIILTRVRHRRGLRAHRALAAAEDERQLARRS